MWKISPHRKCDENLKKSQFGENRHVLCCQEGVTQQGTLLTQCCQATIIQTSFMWTLKDMFPVPSAAICLNTHTTRPTVQAVSEPPISNPGGTGGHRQSVPTFHSMSEESVYREDMGQEYADSL